MAASTLAMWLGRTSYAHIPPAGTPYLPISAHICPYLPNHLHIPPAGTPRPSGAAGGGRWEGESGSGTPLGAGFVREACGATGRAALAKLLPLFAFFSAFWSLYDQTGSAWVLQASGV